MRVYLSGAVTGVEDYMEKFDKAERYFNEIGHEVVNPAKICADLPEAFKHKEYMEVCIAALSQCDMIAVIDGYRTSRGVSEEITYALKKGIAVVPLWGRNALPSPAEEPADETRGTIRLQFDAGANESVAYDPSAFDSFEPLPKNTHYER